MQLRPASAIDILKHADSANFALFRQVMLAFTLILVVTPLIYMVFIWWLSPSKLWESIVAIGVLVSSLAAFILVSKNRLKAGLTLLVYSLGLLSALIPYAVKGLPFFLATYSLSSYAIFIFALLVTSVFLNPAHIIALDAACIGSASYYFLNSDDIRLHEYLAYWILGVISLSLLVYFCGRLVRKLTYSLGEKLDENALLLKEIHHRIKNNLQLVSSVINIRPDNSADPAFAEYKNEITARMSAVGNLHELLYKAETASSIDLSNYLKSVWRAFEETTGALPNVNFEFSEVRCGWSSAVALGMILSELTANVAKHSGLNREEAVTCRLERNGNKISLSLANPGEFSLAEEKQKFGRQIIEALAKKRNGSFTLRTDDWGVTATVVVEDQKS